MRVGAIRVAIRRSPGAKSFSVEQLDAGQKLPAGTVEGMLVIAEDVDVQRREPVLRDSRELPELPIEESGTRPAYVPPRP